MAKKSKGPRYKLGLVCQECKNFNYITTKNKQNAQLKNQGKLELKKYCKHCRKATLHKETSKLK